MASRRTTRHAPTPTHHVRSATSGAVRRAVPTRRTLVLLESALLLGLAEGLLQNAVTYLDISPYLRALVLMVGVLGVFALALRILEPLITHTLGLVARLDTRGGALMRIGLHIAILFVIFVLYVRVFFMNGHG